MSIRAHLEHPKPARDRAISGQDIDALYPLGLGHVTGDEVPQDVPAAVSLLRKGAEWEHPDALFVIDTLCQEAGVSREPEKAIRYFIRAAARGHALAKFHLGRCCETGQGTRRNINEAMRWHTLAAKQGIEDSNLALEELRLVEYLPATAVQGLPGGKGIRMERPKIPLIGGHGERCE